MHLGVLGVCTELLVAMPSDAAGARAQPQAYDIRTRLVITGGNLGKRSWVPDVVDVGGCQGFFTLSKEDRSLGAALGYCRSMPRPMENASFITYIAKLRDDAVDKLILQAMKKADPMGDTDAVGPQRITKSREKAFQHAEIPEVIHVLVGPLVDPHGTRLPEITIEVVSTPRRGVNPMVKLSVELLNWMAAVKDMELEVPMPVYKVTSHWDDMELPSLPSPLKYRKRLSALSVYCDYVDKDGRQKTHQETISHNKVNLEAVLALVPTAVENMQQWMSANHHEAVDADSQADSSGPSAVREPLITPTDAA